MPRSLTCMKTHILKRLSSLSLLAGSISAGLVASAFANQDEAKPTKRSEECVKKMAGTPTQSLRSKNTNEQRPMKSDQMTRLYGEAKSNQVYNRLQHLDSELNELIQRIAYDVFWAREGLTINEKSAVTIATLIVLAKEEQIQIHLNGFLDTGGTRESLIEVFFACAPNLSPDRLAKSLLNINLVLRQRSISDLSGTEAPERRKSRIGQIATLSSTLAIGNQEQTESNMRELLTNGFDRESVRSVILHQIVYAGFPTAMNGFAALDRIGNIK